MARKKTEDSQILRIAIRRSALTGTCVTNLISNRFYPGELGVRKRIRYPCANFRVGGGSSDHDTYDDVSRSDAYKSPNLVIWTHSKKSWDEAYKVYETIYWVLHNRYLSEDKRRIVCREDVRPMEAYEPATEVYFLRASWEVRMLNYE
ncbi:hypothetical protein ES703_01625 [subsurface metagenome]